MSAKIRKGAAETASAMLVAWVAKTVEKPSPIVDRITVGRGSVLLMSSWVNKKWLRLQKGRWQSGEA